MKRYWSREEHRKQQSTRKKRYYSKHPAWNKGKRLSKIHKQNISLSRIGKSAPNRKSSKPFIKEHKQKITEGLRKWWSKPKHRKKQSESKEMVEEQKIQHITWCNQPQVGKSTSQPHPDILPSAICDVVPRNHFYTMYSKEPAATPQVKHDRVRHLRTFGRESLCCAHTPGQPTYFDSLNAIGYAHNSRCGVVLG